MEPMGTSIMVASLGSYWITYCYSAKALSHGAKLLKSLGFRVLNPTKTRPPPQKKRQNRLYTAWRLAGADRRIVRHSLGSSMGFRDYSKARRLHLCLYSSYLGLKEPV